MPVSERYVRLWSIFCACAGISFRAEPGLDCEDEEKLSRTFGHKVSLILGESVCRFSMLHILFDCLKGYPPLWSLSSHAFLPPFSLPLSQTFSFLVSSPPPTRQSSILLRFTDDSFDDHIQSTIGVDFKVKHMDVMDKRVKLTVWDTAGQERFRTLTSSYYRGAQGVIMVYDVTRRDSFENLDTWLKEIKLYSPNNGEGVVKLLVGNKIDLERRVPREEAEAWARRNGMLFLEASAKTRTGIRQCFMEVVQKILEDPDLLMNTVPGRPKVQLRPQGRQGGASLLEDDDEGLCC